MNLEQWQSYFVKPTPRPYQIEPISDIINFFESNLYEQQIYLLNAPTGVGKSAIALTVANYFARKHGFGTNYLVNNKFLEQQILHDFPNLVHHTYGRSNFTCLMNGKTCDGGYCLTDQKSDEQKCTHSAGKKQMEVFEKIIKEAPSLYEFKFKPEELDNYYTHYAPVFFWKSSRHCEYWDTKVTACDSSIALHNYAYYLLENKYIGDFRQRYLVICDEGHKLEDVILDFVSLSLSSKVVDDLKIPICFEKDEIENWIQRIQKTIEYLKGEGYQKFIKQQIAEQYDITNIDNQYEIDKANELKNAYDVKGTTILQKLNNIRYTNPKDWVIEYNSRDGTNIDSVVFKPIEVKKYTNDVLLNSGLKFLIMSGTLLSKEKIIDTLGLNTFELDDRLRWLSLESPFDVKNREFIYIPTASMNYNSADEGVIQMIPIIKTILQKHQNEKGIIHTKSYKLADTLRDKLGDFRILTHDTKSRSKTIDRFLNDHTNHYVLTSPSIEEGLDLYDDRCRFIIIMKMPFLSLANEQIKKRLKLDPVWYTWKCVQTIIQEAGRGVRHSADYCKTYMLDANFGRVYDQYRSFFPVWFQNAIITIKPDDFLLENT